MTTQKIIFFSYKYERDLTPQEAEILDLYVKHDGTIWQITEMVSKSDKALCKIKDVSDQYEVTARIVEKPLGCLG